MESPKFRNKYRIESARLQHYDYSSDGAYFVTICAYDRKHFFGEIETPQAMHFSDIGTVAQQCWQQIPDHFPFVELDEWVVMPNHIHGILIFNGARHGSGGSHRSHRSHRSHCSHCSHCRDAKFCVSTENGSTQNGSTENGSTQTTGSTENTKPTETKPTPTGNIFGPQSQNLGSVIRGFKIGVTKYVRQNTNIRAIWQPRFHDRIIRSNAELYRTGEYIRNNPANWMKDLNNPESLYI